MKTPPFKKQARLVLANVACKAGEKNYIKNPDLCFICLGLKAAEISSLPSSVILDAKEIKNLIAKQILVST